MSGSFIVWPDCHRVLFVEWRLAYTVVQHFGVVETAWRMTILCVHGHIYHPWTEWNFCSWKTLHSSFPGAISARDSYCSAHSTEQLPVDTGHSVGTRSMTAWASMHTVRSIGCQLHARIMSSCLLWPWWLLKCIWNAETADCTLRLQWYFSRLTKTKS